MGPDRHTGRMNTLVMCMLILGWMRHTHVVRSRILGVTALNSIGTCQHIGAFWELVKHRVHIGVADLHSRVARLGVSHMAAIAEAQIFESSGEIIYSRICVFSMHVGDRTRSECMSRVCGVHVTIYVLAGSQCLTRESGGQIAVVCTCMIKTSKPDIHF